MSRNAGAVDDRTGPAIVQVAAAQRALEASYAAARDSLTGKASRVEGPGEEYRVELNAATQSLAKAAMSTVADDSGRQTLRTATGLVSSYDFLVQQAARSSGNHALRDAYLGYADRTLHRPGSGVVTRLEKVQSNQFGVLRGQTSFGWLLRLVWAVAFTLLAVLAWLLVDTQRRLRRHFRRLVSPWLAVATLLPAAALPLAVFAAQIQSRLGSARAILARGRTDALEEVDGVLAARTGGPGPPAGSRWPAWWSSP
ncbi:hypothetical protein ACFQ2B_12660 [Streptomyces stramineus]